MLSDPPVRKVTLPLTRETRYPGSTVRSRLPLDHSPTNLSSEVDHDIEKESVIASQEQYSTPIQKTGELQHYQIADEVWHFASVDWGSNCEAFQCLGLIHANGLVQLSV